MPAPVRNPTEFNRNSYVCAWRGGGGGGGVCRLKDVQLHLIETYTPGIEFFM